MTLSAAAHSFIAPSICRPRIVYAPLGVENVYQPNISYAPEDPYQQAGPSALADFNHQSSGIVQERAHLPGHVVLQAGGRFVRVTDFNYTARTLLGCRSMQRRTPRCRASPSTAITARCCRSDPRLRGGSITQAVSSPLHDAPGGDRREIRARNSAHRRTLPHAPALLLSQGDRWPRRILSCRKSRGIYASNPRDTKPTMASN